MPHIRILPDAVVNQIAAGEVVERPAAVVKELVENALDAGATRIDVEFHHGGGSMIRVEDNGAGMTRDDALLALERHATSKIAEFGDLNRLATFGFRGEALPSIASVSRLTLRTRAAGNDSGTELLVNGGKLVHVKDCGRSVGTGVEVAHLFHSVPARRKFLKSDATEAGHIVQTVRLYALASPNVAFTLLEDGRVVLRSPECRDLRERVGEIFGRELAASLLAIDAQEQGMALRGLLGPPGMGRSARHELILFVNGRPVEVGALGYALREGYRESLPKGRYPVAFVFFECDPAAVDVNVHPSKREVRFRREAGVRSFVESSVAARLGESGRAQSAPIPGPAVAESPAPYATEARERAGEGWTRPNAAGIREAGEAVGCDIPENVPPLGAAKGPAWRFVGLAQGHFALFETASGIVILDRRAALERIWFERLRRQFDGGRTATQRLLAPIPLELDPVSAALLLECREFLNGHGFEIADFGARFFRIEGIPDWIGPDDAESFLRDFIGAARDGRLLQGDAEMAREELARLASARAVRLPASAAEADIRATVAELFSTRFPLTSPAGRPTFVELDRSELNRRFQKG